MLNNLKFELIEKTLYNFNLISITSSELMEFYFEGDSSYKITPTTIPEINHFNTYIVSQNRENQKIHFIQFDKFDSILNNYDYLCEWNEKYYFTLIYQFYKNIFRKNDDRRILFDDIEKEIISENKFVGVTGQLALIEHLRTLNHLDEYHFDGKLPTKECLDSILRTIYNYLFTDHDKGRNFDNDVGRSILIGLTKYYAYYAPSFKALLVSNTVQKARKSDNARIRYVFDLMSKYFEFIWPKYLKTFENMYNFVASEKSQRPIDLAMLIAQLEYGTTKNHEIILRDSGLPNEIVKKISRYFTQCESFEDIQKTKVRKRKAIKKAIYPIEYKILTKYL